MTCCTTLPAPIADETPSPLMAMLRVAVDAQPRLRLVCDECGAPAVTLLRCCPSASYTTADVGPVPAFAAADEPEPEAWAPEPLRCACDAMDYVGVCDVCEEMPEGEEAA